MNQRTTEWYIECINEAACSDSVLKAWREAEEHLVVAELVKVHEACRNKIIESLKEVKK